jgi:diguanylate cyclase (GGDEF)-like protein
MEPGDEVKGAISGFRLAALCTLITALIVIGVALGGQDPSRASKPFRIGFQQSPPFQFAENGQPTGPAIEVVSEAARRKRIPIEWVFSPDGPETTLQSGKTDLWPLIGDLPERRKFLYISDPWARISFWLVSRKASAISTPQDVIGRRLAYVDVSVATHLAETNFPGAKFMPQPSNVAAFRALCSGEVDASMIAGSNADAAGLREVPECRNAQLNFYTPPYATMNYGIGASLARADARKAADALREEIGNMSRDGALSAIYFRWFNDPANDTATIYYLTEAQRRNAYLIIAVCALTVLLGLLGWQTSRVRVARKAAEHLNTELKEASLTDPLTRLHNRRFFQIVVEREITRVLREYSAGGGRVRTKQFPNRDIVFYLVDIDHFKSVNDLHGHHIGDSMLIQAARRIRSVMRQSDMIVRWGGEEFLVISYPTERDQAEILARRIMEEFSTRPFTFADSISIRKTCSIGWAPFPWFVKDPAALDYEEVLKLADRALYLAKESGRNCAVGSVPANADPLFPQQVDPELSQMGSEYDQVSIKICRTPGPVLEPAHARS